MHERPAIDASLLPPTAFDNRAPVWWGNTLMLFIETTTMLLLVTSYFYLWQNYTEWPPPRVMQMPPIHETLPRLGFATANVVMMLASCLLMFAVDRAAREYKEPLVMKGMATLGLIGVATIVLRVYECRDVHFWWDENAYASIVWGILAMHWIYLMVGMIEMWVNLGFIYFHGLDEKTVMDTLLTAVYWYWMCAMGVVTYLVVFIAPRFM